MVYWKETQFGFDYGAAVVTRCMSDEKTGAVHIRIETPKKDLMVYVTKTGKVRVHDKTGDDWRELK